MIATILPIHNSRNTLANSLKSLLAQTHKFNIVFIIDDASTDNCNDIITKYQNAGLKITYFRKDINEGPGAARQTGLNLIYNSGLPFEYVFFMDSDDIINPLALNWLYTTAIKNNLDICYGKINNAYGEPVDEGTCDISVCGKLCKISFLKENNIQFPPYYMAEDTYFTRMCSYKGAKVATIPNFVYNYCNNKESITRSDNHESRRKYEWQVLLVALQLVDYLSEHYEDKYIKEILYRICHIYSSDQCLIHERKSNEYTNAIKSILNKPIIQGLIKNNIYKMNTIVPTAAPYPYNFYFKESFGQWIERYTK